MSLSSLSFPFVSCVARYFSFSLHWVLARALITQHQQQQRQHSVSITTSNSASNSASNRVS
jgi:hypothetical protein